MNTTKEEIQEALEAVRPKKRKPDPKPPGRNEPCPCLSGRKYKKCCLITERKKQEEHLQRLYTPPEPIEDQANTPPANPSPFRRKMPLHTSMVIAAALMGGFHDTRR
jgi:hypothetical protein